MILFDESFALVEYIEDKNIGIITWKGRTTSEEYKRTFNSLLDIQEEKNITRFISDTRKQAVISPNDRKWFETVALPRAIEQGLKISGIVFDGNAFKKYYLNVIIGATNKFKLPLKLISTREEAIEWVMTK